MINKMLISFQQWLKQRKLNKLKLKLAEEKSQLEMFKSVANYGVDSFLAFQEWPEIEACNREIKKLESQIGLLRSFSSPITF